MAASAVDKVFDELGKMSVLDLVELKKKIEDEWGITAAAPIAVAAPGAVAGGRRGRHCHRSRGGDAPLLLERVLQLHELEHGHLAERLDELRSVGCHLAFSSFCRLGASH